MKYEHIISWAMNTPWAITPDKLATIMDLLRFRALGGRLSAEEIEQRIGAAQAPQMRTINRVMVMPLYGVIAQRADMMTESSGGTSIDRFTARFREAVADPGVGAIVLDVDSPGGAVSGVDELSSEIYRARGSKPIVAVANSLAASAAYWIASAADELAVTPSGEVGSIGVFAAHEDWSRAYDTAGVTPTLISAGKYKTEANPYQPLSDEARAAIQARVDDYYGMFTKAVARNRKRPLSDVRGGFGEGRVVGAREALAQGMVDSVETLDEVLARVTRGSTRGRARAEEIEYRKRRLRAAAW
jgi:signal peptide peptidase SppA